MKVEILPLRLPYVREGDDVAGLILRALQEQELDLEDGDVVVVTEKIVARAEGREVELDNVEPSAEARRLAEVTGKDPRVVQLILNEAREVLAAGENFIIVETRHGFVCANAGIDQSNVEEGRAKLLPLDPDRSAREIRRALEEATGRRLGVVIADSFGRSFRLGSVGVAIGCSGIVALLDRRGERDLLGRELKVTRVAVADCIASAANLVMGEGSEGIPVAIVRGTKVLGEGRARDLIRPKESDVFRR
ncbi:MAG: coenzyme F420-0:L-glutamate ligase [Euryarchaeota archaeon]|nr:coenzyme F420-0:L-glutamate ligase [Euryarchaeota archaeon]